MSGLGFHWRPWARVAPAEVGGLERAQAQELQQAAVHRRGLAEIGFAVDDVHLLAGKVPEDPLELLSVVATALVGVVAVREALVARIVPHQADLTGQWAVVTFLSTLLT